MIETKNPETLFLDIWENLNKSIEAIDNGGKLDMISLDNKVRNFCVIVTKLPAPEAKLYSSKIDKITKYLEQIVQQLTAKKDSVKGEIDMVTQRQRAILAYEAANFHNIKNKK
jgi:hypothetical protein